MYRLKKTGANLIVSPAPEDGPLYRTPGKITGSPDIGSKREATRNGDWKLQLLPATHLLIQWPEMWVDNYVTGLLPQVSFSHWALRIHFVMQLDFPAVSPAVKSLLPFTLVVVVAGCCCCCWKWSGSAWIRASTASYSHPLPDSACLTPILFLLCSSFLLLSQSHGLLLEEESVWNECSTACDHLSCVKRRDG